MSEQQGTGDPERPADDPSRGGVLALLLSLVALGAAGYLWWEQQQLREALQAPADDALTARLDELEARIGRMDDVLAEQPASDARLEAHDGRIDRLAGRIDALDRRTDAFDEELGDWPLRFAELSEAIDAAAGVSDDARRRWQLAEAEHLLGVAHAAASVSADAARATRALRLADDRVRRLGDPDLLAVREAIGDAIASLAAQRDTDRDAAMARLDGLDAVIESLPVTDAPRRDVARDSANALDAAEPGLGRAWLATRQALTRVVSVRRDDDTASMPMGMADAGALRRTLALHVGDARLALLRRDESAYESHVAAARAWLERWFDHDDRAVAAAADDLDALAGLSAAQPLPPVDAPLERLREYARDRESAR